TRGGRVVGPAARAVERERDAAAVAEPSPIGIRVAATGARHDDTPSTPTAPRTAPSSGARLRPRATETTGRTTGHEAISHPGRLPVKNAALRWARATEWRQRSRSASGKLALGGARRRNFVAVVDAFHRAADVCLALALELLSDLAADARHVTHVVELE